MAVRFTFRFQARSRSAYRSRSPSASPGPRAMPKASSPRAQRVVERRVQRPPAHDATAASAADGGLHLVAVGGEVLLDVAPPRGRGRAARPRRRTGSPSWCSPSCSSKDRRSTAAEKSFSSLRLLRFATLRARRAGAARLRARRAAAEEPLALAPRRDALDVDEREVDLPPLARADRRDGDAPCPVRRAARGEPLRHRLHRRVARPRGSRPRSRFTHLRPSARGFTTRFTRYCIASTSAERELDRVVPRAAVSATADRLRRLLHLDVHRRAEPREQLVAELPRARSPSPAPRRGAASSSVRSSMAHRPPVQAAAGGSTAGCRCMSHCCWAIESTLFTKM